MREYITDIDKLLSELGKRPVSADRLVSRNASADTVRLFEYLKSVYGKKFISGQQYLQREELEDEVYFAETGDLPAIRGYDLMDMDKERGDDQVNRAIKWATDTGCIITMCWHWYAPDDMDDTEHCDWSFYYKTTSYDRKTSFDLLKAVEYGTPEYEFAVLRIDKAAAALREFEKAGVPVLFRPLHEANGDWFWWGRRKNAPAETAAAYKKLWYMIFDRIENFHGLSNIIWVWNGQDKEMQVHPNTFDIAGDDIYSERDDDHGAQKERFELMKEMSRGKLVTLSECGYIPAPEEMRKNGVNWLWWLPWWGSFTIQYGENNRPSLDESGKPRKTEKYMRGSFLKDTFADCDVVTLSKLPFFKGKDTLPETLRKQ